MGVGGMGVGGMGVGDMGVGGMGVGGMGVGGMGVGGMGVGEMGLGAGGDGGTMTAGPTVISVPPPPSGARLKAGFVNGVKTLSCPIGVTPLNSVSTPFA